MGLVAMANTWCIKALLISPDGSGVYRLPLSGGLPELISHPLDSGETLSRYKWSPTDEWLTYTVVTAERTKTFVKRPESTDYIELTEGLPAWVDIALPRFLDNDEGVIYLADIEEDGRRQFYLTSLDTGERSRIGANFGIQDMDVFTYSYLGNNRIVYSVGEDIFLDGFYLLRIPEPSSLMLLSLALSSVGLLPFLPTKELPRLVIACLVY